MELAQFSNLSRPRFAKFDDLGDKYSGTVVLEPEWTVDPLDPDRQLLAVTIQDDRGVYWQVNCRSNLLIDTIFDALIAADADGLEVGGRLEIEFIGMRAKCKVYRVTYEEADHCACAAPGSPDQLTLFDPE
jgi:hypothetical protein